MEATDQAKAELDKAFEQLYRDHLRDVYSYSYYRVGNHHDAEDLTEQAFLQAYRHFERAQRESNGRPLRTAGIEVFSAELTMLPQSTIPVDGGEARRVLQLIDALEDLEDVQNVYANFDIPEEVMASLG